MASFEKQVVRLLRDNDCVFVRHGKGGHDIWFSPKTGRNFTVDSRIKSRFTANAIMKQSGIRFHF